MAATIYRCAFCFSNLPSTSTGPAWQGGRPEAKTRTLCCPESKNADVAVRAGWRDAEIREFLSGNFCRCAGYNLILNAVRDAAGLLTEK